MRDQRINFLLGNPFPSSEEEFYDSSICLWMDRIEEGLKKEIDFYGYSDFYIEEFYMSQRLSQDMHAALFVHMWSKFEEVFSNCFKAWKILHPEKEFKSSSKIKVVVSEFNKTFEISLKNIPNSSTVNGVRVMANSYKHNGGKYVPDSFSLDEILRQDWQIQEYKLIKYQSLPIYDIVIACGEYIDILLDKFLGKVDSIRY